MKSRFYQGLGVSSRVWEAESPEDEHILAGLSLICDDRPEVEVAGKLYWCTISMCAYRRAGFLKRKLVITEMQMNFIPVRSSKPGKWMGDILAQSYPEYVGF